MNMFNEEEIKQRLYQYKKIDKKQDKLKNIGDYILLFALLIGIIYMFINLSLKESGTLFYFIIWASLFSFISLGLFFIIFSITFSFKKKKITESINLNYKISDIEKNNKGWLEKYNKKLIKLKKNALLLSKVLFTIFTTSLIAFILDIINNSNEELSLFSSILLLIVLFSLFALVVSITIFCFTNIKIYNIDGYIALYYFGFSNILIVEDQIKDKSFFPSPFQILLPNNELIVFVPDRYFSSSLIVKHQHLEYIGFNSNDFSLPDIKK